MNSKFHFKRFSVFHHESSMPVGMDSIILGSIANVTECARILDVGTGCGLLALMCAQRNLMAVIDAIDIDKASVEEAMLNFRNSEWSERLNCKLISFEKLNSSPYDLIISNPPYFKVGVNNPSTQREIARHQSVLSPQALLEKGLELIKDNGKLIMIIPSSQNDSIIEKGINNGWRMERLIHIIHKKGKKEKRSILEFRKVPSVESEISNISYKKFEDYSLILFDENNNPSEEFLSLCNDFYLNF